MKRFMYLSIGVLCLALTALVGFHVGTQAVQAKISGSGIIAATSCHALDENGAVWVADAGAEGPLCWVRKLELDPPVDLATIKFWYPTCFTTVDNHMWKYHQDQWHDCGLWPSDPTPAEGQSWGEVKNKYEPEGNQ